MRKLTSFCILLLLPLLAQASAPTDLLSNPSKDPMQEFARWQKSAKERHTTLFDKAALATIDDKNYPQQRYMHIRSVNDQGFIFTTHSHTPKVTQFEKNKKASIIFLWQMDNTFLQVRVNGEIEQLAPAKTRITQDNLQKDFYEYVLKPQFIQFAVVDKANDIVTNNYLNYSRIGDDSWKMNQADYKYPTVDNGQP